MVVVLYARGNGPSGRNTDTAVPAQSCLVHCSDVQPCSGPDKERDFHISLMVCSLRLPLRGPGSTMIVQAPQSSPCPEPQTGGASVTDNDADIIWPAQPQCLRDAAWQPASQA